MSDQPDPLSAFPDFTAAVGDRLEAGAKAYGDRSFGLHPPQLLDELQQEALDIAGWGYVIWRRLQAAQEAAGRLTVKREPMVYHAAGKRPLTVIRDTREQYAPKWPEGVNEQVAKLDFACRTDRHGGP